MKKCGEMYGTGQWEPDVKIAYCERGREPVDIEPIQAADCTASGHSDYYLKFPLYCMNVVFDRQPRP